MNLCFIKLNCQYLGNTGVGWVLEMAPNLKKPSLGFRKETAIEELAVIQTFQLV